MMYVPYDPWSSPKYELRLYCTSSSYFALGPLGIRFGGNPCPIEFPPTCEIRVNQVQITASTKGMKKKPGTAPPAHLGNSVRVSIGHQNRVEMVYVNSQTNSNQPPPSPKVCSFAHMDSGSHVSTEILYGHHAGPNYHRSSAY
jgi:E3 SUMO-protein ligase PIAS1